jgi:D-alanine-D-alanine ligase-like ATP-grasp enzyme
MTVDVRCDEAPAGWVCRVLVTDGGTRTEHEVSVSTTDLARLDPGAMTPDDLVRRSFAFLLAREPATSVLRRFDLMVISRYFPDYERTIRG